METLSRGSALLVQVDGLVWNWLRPKESDISAEGLAKALSHQARWLGHTDSHYSVLQHSLLVWELAKAHAPLNTPLQLLCLLHDIHEAVVGDMPLPLKDFVRVGELNWREYEDKVQQTVFEKLGVGELLNLSGLTTPLKYFDALAMHLEVDVLKCQATPGPLLQSHVPILEEEVKKWRHLVARTMWPEGEEEALDKWLELFYALKKQWLEGSSYVK